MENAETALVQGGRCNNLSLWLRKIQTQRSHSTVCFVHKTRLSSHMLNGIFGFQMHSLWVCKSETPKATSWAVPAGDDREVCAGLSPPAVMKTSVAGRRQARLWSACRDNFTVGLGSCVHTSCRQTFMHRDRQGGTWWMGCGFLSSFYVSSSHLPASSSWNFQTTHLHTNFCAGTRKFAFQSFASPT